MESPAAPTPRRPVLLEVLLLGTLLLAVVYFAGFQSLARRADALDRPLRQAWESFAATNQSSEATAGLSLDQLPEVLEALRGSAAELAEVRRLVAERVRLPAALAEQIRAPFQIIDYENERTRLAESLVALARSKKVALEPAVTNGLPVRTPETTEPGLLWARLTLARELLLTAILSQVGTVRELTQLPSVSHRSAVDGRRLFEELPMRLEVVGGLEPVQRLLTSLPLAGAELEATGLASVLTNKPVLFLDHLLLRKATPDRPGEVRAELVVSGLVPLEAGLLPRTPAADFP